MKDTNEDKKRFGKDVIITVIGQVVVLLVTFGLNKVLSNYVTIGEFGVYNIVKKVSAVIAYIMLLAMGIAIPKYLPECNAKGDKKGIGRYLISALLIICSISIVVISLLAILQVPFANIVFGTEGYDSYIIPTAFYSFTTALTTFVYSYYRAVERYYAYSVSQIVVQILSFVPIFFLYYNLVILLWVWTALYGIFSLLILGKTIWSIWKQSQFTKISDLRSPMKELLSYGAPRLPGEIVLFAFSLVPLVIVANKFGLELSGLFSSAVTVNTTVASLFSFIGIILLPAVSKSLVKNEFTQIKTRIRFLAVIFILFAGLMIVFVELFPEFVLSVLYSPEYFDATPLVRIIIIGVLPNAMYLLFRNPLDAISKFPYNTICLFLSFLVMTVLILIFDTIELCAVAFLIGYVVLGFLSFFAWIFCLHKREKQVSKDNLSAVEKR